MKVHIEIVTSESKYEHDLANSLDTHLREAVELFKASYEDDGIKVSSVLVRT